MWWAESFDPGYKRFVWWAAAFLATEVLFGAEALLATEVSFGGLKLSILATEVLVGLKLFWLQQLCLVYRHMGLCKLVDALAFLAWADRVSSKSSSAVKCSCRLHVHLKTLKPYRPLAPNP